MKIKVKLFATLSCFSPGGLPGTPFAVELKEGATLQDLVEQLGIPAEETKITFVNGIIQILSYVLKPGDDTGIFPPIGGGLKWLVWLWIVGFMEIWCVTGGKADQGSFANLQVDLPEGGTVGDLLSRLQMPSAERGITFINGELSAMPGIQPDLGHILHDGDRVAFFHLNSMWPFQYRHGVPMVAEMSQAVQASEAQGLHHTYKAPNEHSS